jgi:hypothetical protein
MVFLLQQTVMLIMFAMVSVAIFGSRSVRFACWEQLQETMLHSYPEHLVAEIQGLIDLGRAGKRALNTAYEDISDRLIEEKIVQTRLLKVEEVMCHQCNRSSMGLNGFNVHKNGFEILTVGCDPKELNKAAAFEICPIEPVKTSQVTWNANLADSSGGLLAPLTNDEKVMSVGTGHFTAFCRAVNARCKTPITALADPSGRLFPDLFRSKDRRMGKVLDEGIEWRIFPWQAEVAWPLLPDLCQKALNASHTVTSRSTELEVMCAIADYAKDAPSDTALHRIVDAVSLSRPTCAAYITKVGELAVVCGGGAHAPMLRFMDRFAKTFGEHKNLGEEFITAVVDYEHSKTDKVVHVRVAAIATNMVAEKVVDGVARLLVKSDIEKLKSKNIHDVVLQMDARIRVAWDVGVNLLNAKMITLEAFDVIVGKFMVRSMLFVLKKQEVGPMKIVYKNIDEIRDAYISSMRAESADANADLGEWTDVKITQVDAASKPSSSKDQPAALMMSVDQLNSPTHILAQRGFELGSKVREKGVDNSDVYIVKVILGDTIELHLHTLFEETGLTVKTNMSTLMEKWSIYNGKLPVIMKSPSCLAHVSQTMVSDKVRSDAFKALLDYETNAGTRDILYAMYPAGIIANGSIAKGSLTLAPLTPMSNIFLEKKSGAVQMNIDKTVVYTTQPPKPSKPEDATDKYVYVPFWWVETTHVSDNANMRFASVKVGDTTIPVLQNSKVIAKRDRIMVYKAKAQKHALQGSEVIAAPAQKKGRGK